MSMNIPVFTKQKVVDSNGYFTDSFQQYFDQLVSTLQSNFNEQGVKIPNVAAETVAELSKSGNGNLLYVSNPDDPDSDKVQVLVNGTYKTVTLT